MIARAAEGSVRDSLSIFDQAIAHSAGAVTADTVRNMLGLADRARVIDLFEHVMRGDMAAALAEFRAQYDTGADPATVLTDLAEFTHFVTRLRFVPTAAGDASLTEDERTRGAAFAQTLSVRVLSRAWQMLLKGIPEVQASNRPVSAAEMVLIRLAHAADLPTLDEAVRMLDGAPQSNGGGGARAVNGGGSSATAAALSSAPSLSAIPSSAPRMQQAAAPVARLVEAPAENPTPAIVSEVRAEPVVDVPIRSLDDIAALAETNRDMTFKVLFRRCVRFVSVEPGRLDVALTADAPKTLLNDISTKLKAWTNRHWLVSLSREEGGQTLAEAESAKRESVFLDASQDPAVAAIIARFPGAKVIDVRIADSPDLPESATDTDMTPDPAIDDDDN
ncbi:MAG: DNA polymerase III subunit gamma/tau, partial [Tardiphaga sp.]